MNNTETNCVFCMCFDIGVIMPLLLVGLVGNVMSIVVIVKDKKLDSQRLLFNLAVVDLISLMVELFLLGTKIIINLQLVSRESPFLYLGPVVLNYVLPVVFAFSATSTLLLAFNHTIAVTKPLKVKLIFTKKRTTLISAVICLTILICYLPKALEYKAVLTTTNLTVDTKLYTLQRWAFANGNFYEHFDIVLFVCFAVLPVILMISCIIMIIRGMTVFKRRRQTNLNIHQSKIYSKDKKITVMLCCKAIVYVACVSPQALLPKIESVLFSNMQQRIIISLVFGVMTLNHSMNWILYSLTNPAFKQAYKNLFIRDRVDLSDLYSFTVANSRREDQARIQGQGQEDCM